MTEMKLLKINLSKLNGAAIRTLRGDGGPERCIIIPVDPNPCIFVDRDERYAILSIMEMPMKSVSKYGDTDMLKASVSKRAYAAMTDEERMRIPILGNGRPFRSAPGGVENPPAATVRRPAGDDDDLPF